MNFKEPLFGGLVIPTHCLLTIHGDSDAAFVHFTKAGLGFGVTLFGGLAKPEHRLRAIYCNTVAAKGVHQHHSECVLCLGLSLSGQWSQNL